MTTEADFEKFRGKLRGKMVLTADAARFDDLVPRRSRIALTGEELFARTMTPDPAPVAADLSERLKPTQPVVEEDAAVVVEMPIPPTRKRVRRFRDRLNAFLKDEGVAVHDSGHHHRRWRHRLRIERRRLQSARSTAGSHGGAHARTLQPHRAIACAQHARQARIRHPQHHGTSRRAVRSTSSAKFPVARRKMKS
jgi:hypothetical protein